MSNDSNQNMLALVDGDFSEPRSITQALRRAASEAHLVTPSTVCPVIPEGFSVAMSATFVQEADTYPIDPKKAEREKDPEVGLGATALSQIANSAGVTWCPEQSGRLDDRRHPYYVHYRAVGVVRQFDGTEIVLQGEKVMDLRDGSPMAGKMGRGLAMARQFILEHAETKARNRAIRRLGIRPKYRLSALQKPFVVAKMTFTGQTDDPELRKDFARMRAAAALGANRALFGDGSARPAGLLSGPQATQATEETPPVPDAPQGATQERERPTAPPPNESQMLTVPSRYAESAGVPLDEAPSGVLTQIITDIRAVLDTNRGTEEQRARAAHLLDVASEVLDSRRGGGENDTLDDLID